MNILIRLIEFQLKQKINIKRLTAVTNQFSGIQATSRKLAFAVVMTHYLHKSNILLRCNLINNINNFLLTDEQSDNALEKDNEEDKIMRDIKSGKFIFICLLLKMIC